MKELVSDDLVAFFAGALVVAGFLAGVFLAVAFFR